MIGTKTRVIRNTDGRMFITKKSGETPRNITTSIKTRIGRKSGKNGIEEKMMKRSMLSRNTERRRRPRLAMPRKHLSRISSRSLNTRTTTKS